MLRAVNDQTITAGQVLNLPTAGRFTYPYVQGDFTYQIDWGDGSTPDAGAATIIDSGSDTTPMAGIFSGQHTYTSAGVYYVAETVSDPDGDTSTQSFRVTVDEPILDTSQGGYQDPFGSQPTSVSTSTPTPAPATPQGTTSVSDAQSASVNSAGPTAGGVVVTGVTLASTSQSPATDTVQTANAGTGTQAAPPANSVAIAAASGSFLADGQRN